MNYPKAAANFNMIFNEGSFLKNKAYKYRIDPNDPDKVLVTTEEGKEQDLWYSEFDMIFTLLPN